MGKLRGIVPVPNRSVSIYGMSEAIAAGAVASEWPAHLQLDKHQRSLALHGFIADRLRGNPELLAVARENLTRWMPMNRHAQPWLAEWQAVIDQGLDATLALMTDPGDHATDMRQSSPFTGILTNDERRDFLAAWRASHPHVRRDSKV
ncbi:hypothetical protein [Paraburkholderia tagetis]|uniref:Uncharacterized protein n=1 Tax=Paraburkholderia tagetis TaxID=2913261 RepID=A0A9X2A1D4_9BURK|nr:hypothetical protein [Paraburkholderia tagetis]MCG5078904.1 hypothetical protein [Paraburkholderia tagetis]